MTTTCPLVGGSTAPFGVLRLTTAHDGHSELYPRPAAGRDAIELCADDGDTRSFPITGVAVADVTSATPRAIAQIPELRATLHVTHARVAVASTRFDTGRRRRGAPVGARAGHVDGVLGSSAPGEGHPVLVGHVRLTWVVGVHARRRPSLVSPHTLAIGFRDPTTGGFGSLALTLGRRVPAAWLAREIATAAAHAQARAGDVEPDLRARLDAFARSPSCTTPGALVAYAIPQPARTRAVGRPAV